MESVTVPALQPDVSKGRYQKNSTKISMDAVFKYAVNHGTIGLDDVMNSEPNKEVKIMRSIIDTVHPYAIKRSGERYVTYIKDDTKPGGRRQIRKSNLSDLYKYLLNHYGLTGSLDSQKTYGELYQEWEKHKKKFVGAKNIHKGLSTLTIHRYRTDYDRFILGSDFSKTPLESITPTMIEDFLLLLIEKFELVDRSVSNVMGYLNQSFEYATRSNYLNHNPMKQIDRRLILAQCPTRKQPSDDEKIFTSTQLAAIRRELNRHEAANPKYMPDYAIELAMLTGMRVGELAVLRWTNIDDQFIHIDYSEHKCANEDGTSEIVIGEPKNGKHRRIPITPDMRKLLDRIQEVGQSNDQGFLFADEEGIRYSANSIGKAMARRARAVGIEKGSIHRIRRTVSSLLNQTLPQRDVSALLGHTEQVNEMYYNYSASDIQEKQSALITVAQKMHGITVVKAG